MRPEGSSIPTVAMAMEDGTLIELVYDPVAASTALAVCRPGAVPALEARITLPNGATLIPYAASNNLLASGCVLLPSAIGKASTKGELLGAIQAFLHRYLDLTPAFEDIAAHYVLLSWVYDAFDELPYLRFRGDYGTGKTRALLAIGSLCYRPIFASGASTVSPIFHMLDAFAGTLILDEADLRFSDATRDVIKILNNGNAIGMPVLRTMSNRHGELNPKAFRVYGPKLVAMRESFSDRALESRFLTEETGGRVLRTDIPIHVPRALRAEAQALRNQLLTWRFASRSEVKVDPSRTVPGIEPRLNQSALALLSLVDDVAVRRDLECYLVAADERIRGDRASTEEAQVLRALDQTFAAHPTARAIRISEVLQTFSISNSAESQISLSAKRLGWIVRTRLRIRTTKSNGVYVIPQSERARVVALRARFES